MVRMQARGLVEVDVVAALLGVSRSEVIRRAVVMALPKLREQGQFRVETGPVDL